MDSGGLLKIISALDFIWITYMSMEDFSFGAIHGNRRITIMEQLELILSVFLSKVSVVKNRTLSPGIIYEILFIHTYYLQRAGDIVLRKWEIPIPKRMGVESVL